MNDTHEAASRRILVAIDTSPHGSAALEAAARLATELRAELEGLFIEDINLLRLAGLPFAREIQLGDGVLFYHSRVVPPAVVALATPMGWWWRGSSFR